MKTQNPSLWIDITDLYYWKGSFTGIQNVVDNYSQRFLKQDNAKLFIFEPDHHVFREVKRDEWELVRSNILRAAATKTAVAPVQRPFKHVAWHYTAVTLKAVLPPKLQHSARRVVQARRKQQRETLHSYPFGNGDTILIIGGNWGDDFRGFTEGLRNVKDHLQVQTVHVVHDLIPLKYPNYYLPNSTGSFERYFTDLVQDDYIDAYLADSKATATDLKALLANYGKRKPIRVIRLGEDFSADIKPHKPSMPIEPAEYLLCVGTFEPRKNHTLLYTVAKLAHERGYELPKIVIVGKKGWMESEVLHSITTDPDIADRVIVSHTVTNSELLWLYKNCLFTLYPSHYEGWGLPIAESLFHGKFCLSSKNSSMPEVGGSYIDYFSPNDANQLLEMIMRYMQPVHLRSREKTLKSRPAYSWDDSFRDLKTELSKI